MNNQEPDVDAVVVAVADVGDSCASTAVAVDVVSSTISTSPSSFSFRIILIGECNRVMVVPELRAIIHHTLRACNCNDMRM